MSNGTGWQFEPEDLAFFGRVTASVSHELKNVMSIINESAGLLGDLATAAEQGRPLKPERVKKTAGNIGRNVKRGVAIIERINRFAHSVDEPLRDVDLRALLDDVVALAGRFAGLRGATIEASLPPQAVSIRSYPFGLHQVLTEAIRLVVVSMGSLEPVRVELLPVDGGAAVTVGRGAVTDQAEFDQRMARIQALATGLGCAVKLATLPDGQPALALGVPERAPGHDAAG